MPAPDPARREVALLTERRSDRTRTLTASLSCR